MLVQNLEGDRTRTFLEMITQLVKNLPAMQETPVRFLDWKDLLEKGQATHSSILGLPLWSDGKECACNAGDLGLITGLGRFPGGGHGNPLQYSCLENPMDRGAWHVHRVTKSQTRLKRLGMQTGNS